MVMSKQEKKKGTEKVKSLIVLAGHHIDTPREDVHIPQGLYIEEKIHPGMLVVDYSTFHHSKAEREIRKEMISQHKKDIIKAGKDPRKHMNPTSRK